MISIVVNTFASLQKKALVRIQHHLTLLISQKHLQSSGEIMGYFAKDFLYIGSIPIAPLGVYRLMVWQKNKNTLNAYPLIETFNIHSDRYGLLRLVIGKSWVQVPLNVTKVLHL